MDSARCATDGRTRGASAERRARAEGGACSCRTVLVRRMSPPAASDQPPLGRLGSLEVRLACSAAEIRRAQALRYHVFFKEMSALGDVAHPSPQARRRSLRPRLRPSAGHRPREPERARLTRQPQIVGTYRLLRHDVARLHGGFYSVERVRHRAADRAQAAAQLPGARTLLRAPALPQQAHGGAPLARHLVLRARQRDRRHDRLRQPRGHRSGSPRASAQLPASPCGARRRNGGCGRWITVMSR